MRRVFLLVFGIISMLSGCLPSSDYDDTSMLTAEESISCIDELSEEYVSADFAIDINDATEVIGMVDYVFVAKTDKLLGTSYKNCREIERDSVDMEIYDIYTDYQIIVIDNIKGKLKKNTTIEIAKEGGVSKDKTYKDYKEFYKNEKKYDIEHF